MISYRRINKLVKKIIRYFQRDKNKIFLFGFPVIILISMLLIFLSVSFTTLIAFLTMSIMLIILMYYSIDFSLFMKIKEAELNYPDFLEDLSEAKSSGMTMSQAVASCTEGKYGTLTPYIKKLNTLLSWGIPFNKAWIKFTKQLEQSEIITRLNMIILEAFNSGADISAILSSLAARANTIRIIENERKGVIKQQVIMMYILYFGFLGIIILLQKILLPTLYIQNLGAQGLQTVLKSSTSSLNAEYFKRLFLFIILIESVCNGILVGQILEEKIIGGLKHIAVMLVIGMIVFFLFIYPINISINAFVSNDNPAPNSQISVGGTINIDGMPASGVKVEISIPTRGVISTVSDQDGRYYVEFNAPDEKGKYKIKVTVKYKEKVKSINEYIIVS